MNTKLLSALAGVLALIIFGATTHAFQANVAKIEADGYSVFVPRAWSTQVKGTSVFMSAGTGRSTARLVLEPKSHLAPAQEILNEQWNRSIRGWSIDGTALESKTEIAGCTLLTRTSRLTLGSQSQIYSGLVLSTPEANYWSDVSATDRTIHDATLAELVVALKTIRGKLGKTPEEFTAQAPPNNPPATSGTDGTAGTGGASGKTATGGTGATTSSTPPKTATEVKPPAEGTTSAPGFKFVDLTEEELSRHDRLKVIAGELYKEGTDKTALLTEAAVLCGFSIRDDGKIIQTPTPARRLGLILDMTEVRGAAIMQEYGDTVVYSDWTAALDSIWAKIEPRIKSNDLVVELMNTAEYKPATSPRAWVYFLKCLSAQSGRGMIDGSNPDAELDAVQAVMLTRFITEAVAVPLREVWLKHKKPEMALWASIRREDFIAEVTGQQGAPGWMEDAVSGVLGMYGQTIREMILESLDVSELGSTVAGGIVDGLGVLGSIVKFLTSYAFLEGDVHVVEPGNPLTRALDGDGGESRKVTAKFWIKGSEMQNIMKENRFHLQALTGFQFDFDQPKNQPIGGIHRWDIEQDRNNSADHAIRLKPRQFIDISRLPTDADGRTTIDIEGNTRRRALKREHVIPYKRIVPVRVTPQMKEVSM